MAYPPPLNVVRSLSPITELTTPASARSIALPLVDKPYDYKDECPIHPNILSADRGQEEDGNDDRDSTFSHGSNRTVVPSSAEPSPLPVSDSSSPLPSPPSTIRAFSSPTTGLPPPPRPIHSRGDSHSQPTTPQSSALQLDPQAIRDLKTFQNQVDYDSPEEEQEEGDEMDRASVSTAGMAGIGSGIYSDAVKQKKHRPKSLHNTSHVGNLTQTATCTITIADDQIATCFPYQLGATQRTRLTHQHTQHSLSPIHSARP
jgi:hypothetical protein